MPYVKRKYPRKSAKRSVSKYSRRSRKPSQAIKRYVKQAIHRNIENKILVSNAANQAIKTASVGTYEPYQFNLYPIVASGAEQGERQGLRIKPMMNKFHMYCNLLPHDATTNPVSPMMVRMWVVKYKEQSRNAAANTSGVFDSFFEQGNSTLGFQANMLDMILPVNKAKWVVYADKTFKLGVGQNAGGYSGGTNALDNSSFNKQVVFYCGRYWKNNLIYDDSISSRPGNTNLWLVVQAVPANGASGTTTTGVEIHYSHAFSFEDA